MQLRVSALHHPIAHAHHNPFVMAFEFGWSELKQLQRGEGVFINDVPLQHLGMVLCGSHQFCNFDRLGFLVRHHHHHIECFCGRPTAHSHTVLLITFY